jgi:hypothetical protein
LGDHKNRFFLGQTPIVYLKSFEKEDSQSGTNCHQLKLKAADSKYYQADVADPETILCIVQSILSSKDDGG